MEAVSVNNLNFRYGDNIIFDNVCFTVEKGSFLTVVGKGGSGKSTLFKIFALKYKCDSVKFFNKSITQAIEKGYVGYVSLSLNYFKEKVAGDELFSLLKSNDVYSDKIKLRLERIIKKLGIGYMLYSSIEDLSDKDKVLLMFAYQILNKPRLLILDNALCYLDREYMPVIKELVKLSKKCTIINITNNTSECLFGDKVYFLDKEKMVDVSSLNDEIFLDNGLRAPFELLLSSRLKSYDLIDRDYIQMEMLVDELWK